MATLPASPLIEKLRQQARKASCLTPDQCTRLEQMLDRESKAEEQARRAGQQPI